MSAIRIIQHIPPDFDPELHLTDAKIKISDQVPFVCAVEVVRCTIFILCTASDFAVTIFKLRYI